MDSDIMLERVYLTGFMGAGKSTVGRRLADRLDWSWNDLDDIIERKEGRSIPEIFQEDGEGTFRELETSYLEEVSRRSAPFVLAVGGGAPAVKKNQTIMKETGLDVFLKVPFEIAFERIRKDEHRPLVPDGPDARQKLRTLWEERKPIYEQAEWIIDCGQRKPDTIAQEIERKLRKRN
ncbi:MAG: shikimate kinase [bacterium]